MGLPKLIGTQTNRSRHLLEAVRGSVPTEFGVRGGLGSPANAKCNLAKKVWHVTKSRFGGGKILKNSPNAPKIAHGVDPH